MLDHLPERDRPKVKQRRAKTTTVARWTVCGASPPSPIIAKLALAVERDVAASRSPTASLTTAEQAATLVTV